MKKVILTLVVLATMLSLSGCCSFRTPTEGPNSGNVFYSTFFGLSIESAAGGDGLLVK